jgi:hypothetical protein
MNSPRDHLSALRWRAANGRVHASNAWYRAAGRRVSGARAEHRNRVNRRAIDRGRATRLDGAVAVLTSRTPVVRDRINPATGRRRRVDAMMHRTRNEGLARMAPTRRRDAQASLDEARRLGRTQGRVR